MLIGPSTYESVSQCALIGSHYCGNVFVPPQYCASYLTHTSVSSARHADLSPTWWRLQIYQIQPRLGSTLLHLIILVQNAAINEDIR